MRTFLLPVLVLLVSARPAAAFTVYDPTVHLQLVMSSTKELAKFVEMISNQVRQLKTMEEELTTLRHYVDLFGNPARVSPAAVEPATRDLTRPERGLPLGPLVAALDPKAAMLHAGHGAFPPVATTFLTPGGSEVSRDESLYRPVAALQNTADNFLVVSADAATRRASLKAEIARTLEALGRARTDAEVQKLGATLHGLQAALLGTDAELSQATASALVQDIATRADDRRQDHARHERQAAEFTEALENYRGTFRLLTSPVRLPTP